MPSPARDGACCYEDSLSGGEVFDMYCGYCHNAPALAERPFSNFKNVANHMRVRANLTGKEYARLMEFLRRWHDVPPPTPPDTVQTTPKRFIFSQPIQELQKTPAPAGQGAPQMPAPPPPAVLPPAPSSESKPPAQSLPEPQPTTESFGAAANQK
jgi:hypothetical protein